MPLGSEFMCSGPAPGRACMHGGWHRQLAGPAAPARGSSSPPTAAAHGGRFAGGWLGWLPGGPRGALLLSPHAMQRMTRSSARTRVDVASPASRPPPTSRSRRRTHPRRRSLAPQQAPQAPAGHACTWLKHSRPGNRPAQWAESSQTGMRQTALCTALPRL